MVTFAQVMTDEEQQQAYRLRYHVYCLERGYEDAATFPDGCERDEWDSRSWHFLCRGDDGRPFGTVRLIPAEGGVLPLERNFQIDSPEFPGFRPFSAEISRLAVARSLLEDDVTDVRRGGCGGGDVSLALLGLIRSAYQKCLLEGITHFLAVMDRRLHILLRRHGIGFQAIGPTFEYRGPRRPYVLASWDLERECLKRRPDVFRFLREGLPPELTGSALR